LKLLVNESFAHRFPCLIRKPPVRHANGAVEKDEVVVCLKFVLHVSQFWPKEREKVGMGKIYFHLPEIMQKAPT